VYLVALESLDLDPMTLTLDLYRDGLKTCLYTKNEVSMYTLEPKQDRHTHRHATEHIALRPT